MTWRPPEPLAVDHRLEGFDCGKPTLNHWLLHHARQAQTRGSARTFVVILARLAVSRESQGWGLGVGMLQDAIRRTLVIAEQAGIRAILTHPIDEDAARIYTRFGFIASPLRQQQRLLLLKDTRKILR